MSKAIDAFQEDAESYRQYVLAELRLAHKRARLMAVEIEVIGKALSANFIDCDTAFVWLADVNALEFLQPTAPDNTETNDAEA